MTQPNTIPLAPKTMTRLFILQSVLIGGQTIVAATALGDVLGVKVAALLAILVSGAQQAVNSILTRAVTNVATHVDAALSRVDSAIDHAETAAQQSETAASTAHNAVRTLSATRKGIR